MEWKDLKSRAIVMIQIIKIRFYLWFQRNLGEQKYNSVDKFSC